MNQRDRDIAVSGLRELSRQKTIEARRQPRTITSTQTERAAAIYLEAAELDRIADEIEAE